MQLIFDGGSVVDYLKTVNTFLTDNHNEVLTLIFTNPEGVSLKDVWDPAFQESGVANLAFVPPQLPMKQSEVRPLPPLHSPSRTSSSLTRARSGRRSAR